jgi:hypothetical protein
LFGKSSLPEDDIQEPLSLPPIGPDDISSALAEFLTFHLGHSIIPLMLGAIRACTDPLVSTHANVLVALERALKQSEIRQVGALIALDVISETTPDAVRPLSRSIEECASSRSFLVRKIADLIGTRLGLQMPLLIRSGEFLPPTYRIEIELSRSPEVIGAPGASEYGPLPESDDPFAMVSPFNFSLRWIAREAGLEHTNVVVRCTQIMRELDEPVNWSVAASKREQSRYSSSALEFTFRRRKAQIACAALFRVVQELVQAGKLRQTHLDRLAPLLRVHDPWFTRINPISRPGWIEPISGLDRYATQVQGWCESTSDAFGAVKIMGPTGTVILAERTGLKNLDWSTPSEMRYSKVSVATFASEKPDASGDEGGFFESIMFGLLQEYPQKIVKSDPCTIVVENEVRIWDTPGGNWLALNPSLGRALNWQLDPTVPLRWQDQEGHVMVESVWWVDSHLHWGPPHFDDEVGEGWLVLATPYAYEAIKTISGELIHVARISRSYIGDDKQPHNRVTSKRL